MKWDHSGLSDLVEMIRFFTSKNDWNINSAIATKASWREENVLIGIIIMAAVRRL
jgi:hypothetical protein